MVGTKENLKRVVANRVVKVFVVVVLNIWETLIPGAGMFRIVHPQDMHDHSIDHLHLSMSLGVEGGGLAEFGVHK